MEVLGRRSAWLASSHYRRVANLRRAMQANGRSQKLDWSLRADDCGASAQALNLLGNDPVVADPIAGRRAARSPQRSRQRTSWRSTCLALEAGNELPVASMPAR
jgi:hypothetical protein